MVHTINRKSVAGLNFHGIHIIQIFQVILSWCKARALSYMLYLEYKIHQENFLHSSKNHENCESLAQPNFPRLRYIHIQLHDTIAIYG